MDLADGARVASLSRHRDFLLLWGGQTVSAVGSQVSALALPLLAVTVLRATAFEVSLLTFLTSLPFLLVSLPAGVVVDRVRKRRLMLNCDIARMVLIGTVPATAVMWHVTLWQLYAVAGATGVLTVFFDVAYQSYLPVVVQRENLIDGNAKLATTDSLSRLTGPALGGALAGLIGAARTITADAASFAISAVSLMLIRTPERRAEARKAGERVRFRDAMAQGISFVVRHPILRNIVACTGTSNFFWTGTSAIRVVFLVRTLHASSAAVGGIFTVGAAGGLVAGLVARRLTRRVGSARIIWLAAAVPGPVYLLLPLAQPGWGILVYGLGWATYSASAVIYNTAQVAYRQAICPPELLGRMNASVRWLVWGSLPLGALFGGALGTWIGLRAALTVCVLGTWAASLFVIFSPLRRLRDVPTQDRA